MAETRQLPLDLSLDPRFGEEDFLVSGSNADACQLIDAWPDWPTKTLALAGPAASGKSHLLAIWANRSGARLLAARALAKADVPALVSAGAVAIDDADTGALPETELFHLLNLAQEKGASVLLASLRPAAEWAVGTPDLRSRLRRIPVVRIAQPDDALIRALLVKLFVDRQLVVDTTLVDYLAVRLDRSFDGVRSAVERLDRETMARGKRLTRISAAKILGWTDGVT